MHQPPPASCVWGGEGTGWGHQGPPLCAGLCARVSRGWWQPRGQVTTSTFLKKKKPLLPYKSPATPAAGATQGAPRRCQGGGHPARPPSPSCAPESVPAVLLHHVRHLDDELPLLVFLAALECLFLGGHSVSPPIPRWALPSPGLGGVHGKGLVCPGVPTAGIGVPVAGTGVTRRGLGCPGMLMEGVGVPRPGLGSPGSACSRWGSQLGGTHIFPAQGGIAALAEDVSHRVQSRQQQPLLSRAAPHVHPAPRVGRPTGLAQPARGPPGLPLPTAILGAPSTHTELNR